MGYLDGFGVTLGKWLGVHTDSGRRVTGEYPEEVRPKPERFHGRHVLNRYEDGMEKCIGCELCAGVCPASCIYVRGRDNDSDDPTSPGERYGYVYEINYLRCIHCDLCVEACPTEAITETKMFEFAFYERADAIYTKAELVVDDDGRPRQQPWENWQGGFDAARDTSGWMRATAPGGDADFVGIVAWAGELGYGVRPPERDGGAAAGAGSDSVDDHDGGNAGHDSHDAHGHGDPQDAGPAAQASGSAGNEDAPAGQFDAPEGSGRPGDAGTVPPPVTLGGAATSTGEHGSTGAAAPTAESAPDGGAAPDADADATTETSAETQAFGIFDADDADEPRPEEDTAPKRGRWGLGRGDRR